MIVSSDFCLGTTTLHNTYKNDSTFEPPPFDQKQAPKLAQGE